MATRRPGVNQEPSRIVKEDVMARVVVGCAHGNESPDSVVVAYLTAGAALDRGDEVVLWLTSEGVRLAMNGYVAAIRQGMEPPVQRVHDQFIEKGGRFYVCPICFNEREMNEGDLALLEGEHARLLVQLGYTDIKQGDLVDTYARSTSEDTRRKAAKFGAMGSTIRATKPIR